MIECKVHGWTDSLRTYPHLSHNVVCVKCFDNKSNWREIFRGEGGGPRD